MLNIEQALASWREHEPSAPPLAQIVRKLHGGQTNTSYLVQADKQTWVVRLGGNKTAAFGIDRQREKIILEAAAAVDLAPAIAYCAPQFDLLITHYIEGAHIKLSQDESSRARLFELLTRIHALDLPLADTDYHAHAERYWSLITAAGIAIPAALKLKRDAIARSRKILGTLSSRQGICHRDLNPSNIIERGDKLYVLDWEYAAFGSCTFDYACLAVEFNLPLAELTRHCDVPNQELQHAIDLYHYTCELWHLVKQIEI